MSLTIDQLIYDPAANEGAKVGAFIIDADGHQVDVNADGSLNVVGSFSIAPGTEIKITDGTDDLEINADGSVNAVVSATDLDIRDLDFASDSVDVSGSSVSISGSVAVTATDLDIRNLVFANDKVDVSNSVIALDSATLAALENINAVVTATDLDIRNLVFATDKVDASGSSVSVSNKPIVNETNNSIKNSAISATTTAAQLTPTPLSNRKSLIVQNLGNKEIYIGDSGVTSSNGVKISAGANAELKYDASVALYARTASGTADVRILEAANS
jgi:hypothetical protein